MKDFVNEHFAVLVVLVVFTALFSAYMWQIHHQTGTDTVDWLEGEMKEVIGAILMGLTGKGVQLIQGGKNETSSTSTPTSSSN